MIGDPAPAGPLAHVRVLDLSRIMAGPWATQILGDLGADVIKIERPGTGDDTRGWGPPFLERGGAGSCLSGYFLSVNRNKRSVVADLTIEQGQSLVRRLAAEADVVIENFKAGTLQRYGLDRKSLQAINPRLIYCSVTGFGQTGPRRDEPAYDFIVQAMCGLMSVTGEADGRPGAGPQKVGVPVIDIMTGMYAAAGILAALVHRRETGKGQYLDLAMLDVGVAMLANQGMNHLISGATPRRTGNAHPNIQPQDVFGCSDGHIAVVVGNDSQFRAFCSALERPAIAADARFATNAGRVTHAGELRELIQSIMATRDIAAWIQKLGRAGVPCAPINTIPGALADPQVGFRQLVQEISHPAGKQVRLLASPLRFGETAAAIRQAPPMLGEHDAEPCWKPRG